MKNTNKCPKCLSDKILLVKGELGLLGAGNNLAVSPLRIPLARYVCVNCGYAEEWIEEEKNLLKLQRQLAKNDNNKLS